MILGVDPKVDYAFKRMFGSPGCESMLLDLLQSILGSDLESPIESVEIENPYNEKDLLDDKLSILDVKARDSAGRFYNVEMQMLPGRHFRERVVYYLTKIHSQQLKEGVDYSELRETIGICFVNGIIYREFPEYLSRFDLRNTRHPGVLFSSKLAIYLIELPKFQLTVDNLAAALERWCYVLRHGEGLDLAALPEKLKSPAIEQALEVLKMLNQTPQERERYESRLKAQRDYASGLIGARMDGFEDGFEEGFEKGTEEGTYKQLERFLRIRFRDSAHELVSLLQNVRDPDTLDRVSECILSAGSLEEFRSAITELMAQKR